MAHILMTGATGLIGRQLARALSSQGHTISYYTRHVTRQSGVILPQAKAYSWAPENGQLDLTPLQDADAIIHLAGAGIADKRWSSSRKQELIHSRVATADLLLQSLKTISHHVRHVISASAIGYYGLDTGSRVLTENSDAGTDFPAHLVAMWERKIHDFDALGMRTVQMRTGIVLSAQGGALPKLVQPVAWGLGSPLGRGNQMQSWIHIDDIVRLYTKAVEDDRWHGAYNAVAPNPVTNAAMVREIAALLKRPLWAPAVPAWLLNSLLGEMSALVLSDNHVANRRIADETDFQYRFNDIVSALRDLLMTPGKIKP